MSYILGEIIQERVRQEALCASGKFKASCATIGPNEMSEHECNTVLNEEVGEVARAILESDNDNLREELIQVAAVCVAWVERLDLKKKVVDSLT
jgi:NTP pyrophosphatase (non-canonical NTP hydrolase)